MVQPYVPSVDTRGETAIVCLDGEPSHVLRKGAVLRPDEVAPVREDGVGAAEVMYDPDLVVAGTATDDELRFATALLGHVADRFDYVPLYARVDLVAGADGGPVLMELEAVEPNLYLDQAPGSAERVAAAIVARVQR
jgi:O-ureido-D-serine cyclo-ligase